ncbi:hypothetical protein GGR56DRAFT_147953 [Xylariaceae sp. FL0804]|nr:hypothetical protein GGR56DRAFT_147953 [Xylariaceae sp. FL0804]
MSAGAPLPVSQYLHIESWIQTVALSGGELLSTQPNSRPSRNLRDDDDADDRVSPDLDTERPSKRPRHGKADGATFTCPYNAIHPDTPPPTSMSDSSRKRSAAEMEDATITPKPLRSQMQVRPRLPSPKKRGRSNSPTKSRGSLEMFEVPVHVEELGGNVHLLPADVKTLYSELQKARHNEEVVPKEVRAQVTALVGEDEVRPYYFGTASRPGAESLHAALCDITLEAKAAANMEYHETGWNHTVHTPMLRTVFSSRTQNSTAKEGETEEGGRLAHSRFVAAMSATIWNEYLPTKPLKTPSVPLQQQTSQLQQLQPRTAMSDAGSVSSASISYAGTSTSRGTGTGTAPEPEYDASGHGRSDGKKVDYVLALDAGADTPLQRVLAFFLHNEGVLRDLLPHVNQTLYRPLQWSPVAVSVETKVAFQAVDPLLQLGTWTAAGHKRLRGLRRWLAQFRRGGGKGGEEEEAEEEGEEPASSASPSRLLPTTLLVEVVNHDWRVYFACDKDTTIHLYGPLGIGSTRSLVEAYALVAALEAVKRWIETEFYRGIQECLMCEELVGLT